MARSSTFSAIAGAVACLAIGIYGCGGKNATISLDGSDQGAGGDNGGGGGSTGFGGSFNPGTGGTTNPGTGGNRGGGGTAGTAGGMGGMGGMRGGMGGMGGMRGGMGGMMGQRPDGGFRFPDGGFRFPDGGIRFDRDGGANLPACPAGTMNNGMCMANAPACQIPQDGGRQEFCQCRRNNGMDEWRCVRF